MLCGLHFLGKRRRSGSPRHMCIPLSLAIKIIGPAQEGSLCPHTTSSGEGWVLSKLHLLHAISLLVWGVHNHPLAVENGSVISYLITNFCLCSLNRQPFVQPALSHCSLLLHSCRYNDMDSKIRHHYEVIQEASHCPLILCHLARYHAHKSFFFSHWFDVLFMYSWIWCKRISKESS